jgi:predicted aconitase with swiveling domain
VPRAILFNQANTILVQGAVLADITMCDRFEDGDITQLVSTGQLLEIDPDAGVVQIIGD